MCGIDGHLSPFHSRPSRLAVEAMNRATEHRGPDEGASLPLSCGVIAMRRLAIVDVASGRQPMRTPDGRYALVYNGEIYDFQRARSALEARGARFATRSDTEVVLHSLALDGERALERLNGMFALAFVDTRERRALIARDPFGIKPLHYWIGPDGDLVFASELRALLAHPSVPRTLDRRSLAMLLHDRYVADPWTMLEGVRRLPPGHVLDWRDGEVEVRRYARFDVAPEPIDEREALAELRGLLDEVVRSQLVADVPVGLFLSGGIDSSTVAAYASRAAGRTVKSFSIGFSRPDYDESALAREVARHLGTDHHELRIEDGGFDVALFDTILDHVGEPLGDTSCVPTLAVSRLAAEHVKVVLSGDGGDELFGGYDHMFWAARVRRATERTPRFVREIGSRVLAGVAPLAPAALAEPARRARKGLELSLCAPDEQLRILRSLWSERELARLLGPDASLRAERLDDASDLSHLSPEEHAMQVLAETYMPGAILAKVDRMSMAASLEVRVPLLDLRIARFAHRLPLALKVRGRVGKHLLREAGRPLLPRAVYEHRKMGFSIPLASWLDASFWEMFDDLYAPGGKARELFEPRELDATLAACRNVRANRAVTSETTQATRAWLLAGVARWMDRFGVALS